MKKFNSQTLVSALIVAFTLGVCILLILSLIFVYEPFGKNLMVLTVVFLLLDAFLCCLLK